jgi:hypothetical protein
VSRFPIEKLPYYATIKVPVKLPAPVVKRRTKLSLITRLTDHNQLISQTSDPVEIFGQRAPGHTAGNVVIIQRGKPIDDLAPGKPLHQKISNGATCIVFSPGERIAKLFPDDILDVRTATAEFADWTPARGTKLAENLEPMDLKWWARKNDDRAFIASSSHRLKPTGKARELIRYIPPHSYISVEKIPDQYRVLMSEIPIGKGRLWICDLDLDASVDIDPVARIFADNLYPRCRRSTVHEGPQAHAITRGAAQRREALKTICIELPGGGNHVSVEDDRFVLLEIRNAHQRVMLCEDEPRTITARDLADLLRKLEDLSASARRRSNHRRRRHPARSICSSSCKNPTPCGTPHDPASLPATTVTPISCASCRLR